VGNANGARERALDRGPTRGIIDRVCGVVSAFDPGIVGFVRGATGGYTAALVLCLTLQLVSAAIVLRRGGARSARLKCHQLVAYCAPRSGWTDR
jgi:hypothetical protein